MVPTLVDGQEILVRLYRPSHHEVNVGDVILIQHPIQSGIQMVKRVSSIDDEDSITVRGDKEEESTDSRHFGRIRKRHILGVVDCSFP